MINVPIWSADNEPRNLAAAMIRGFDVAVKQENFVHGGSSLSVNKEIGPTLVTTMLASHGVDVLDKNFEIVYVSTVTYEDGHIVNWACFRVSNPEWHSKAKPGIPQTLTKVLKWVPSWIE